MKPVKEIYTINNISIGDSESFYITITDEMLNSFLMLSSDTNTLHTNSDFAKSKGFDGKVVYGMLTSVFYSRLVGVHLPGKLALLQSIDIQFRKPVYVNDELLVHGEVIYINQAYKTIEIKASIINNRKLKVSTAKIRVGFNAE